MTLDVLVKEESAMRMLGVSRKAFNRKIDTGYLRPIERKNKRFFSKRQLKSYVKKAELLQSHTDFIKFLYTCSEMGVKNVEEEVTRPTADDWNTFWQAADHYGKIREQMLGSYEFNGFKPDMLFMVDEARARLNVQQRSVIYQLAENHKIKEYIAESPNRTKMLVTVGSLAVMLGDYAENVLYRSHDVSNITGLSVTHIDRLAKQHDIGLKLGNSKNNSYVFSLEDAEKVKGLKRKY